MQTGNWNLTTELAIFDMPHREMGHGYGEQGIPTFRFSSEKLERCSWWISFTNTVRYVCNLSRIWIEKWLSQMLRHFRSGSKVVWYVTDRAMEGKIMLFPDGAISAQTVALQELSARLECIFSQSERSAEAMRCKMINLDHQSSLQCIAVLPETVKCNMHAVINLK